MQQGLAGTGVAHIQGISALHHVFLDEITVDQGVDALDAHFGRDVAGLQVAYQRVDEHAVTNLAGDFGQEFVGAVHRVSELQGGDTLPAPFFECGAGFGRSHVAAGEAFAIVAFGQDFDRPGDVVFFLSHDHLHAGMIFGGHFPEFVAYGIISVAPVDFFAFPFFIGLGHLINFCDLHGGHEDALFGIEQGDLFTDFHGFVGVEGHGYRPESTVGQSEIFTHGFPVGFCHEAVQRAEATDAHHDQVAFGAGADVNLSQTSGFFLFGSQFRTLK